mmetsp:Transcript_44085/g.84648  ORF Transcript_44085/g.84648 Transcript_44085/m.84648 type:complete len:493 (-) Transcript_44085:116-1594(-)
MVRVALPHGRHKVFRHLKLPSSRLLATAPGPPGPQLAAGARDYPWRQWYRLEKFLKTGQVVVIDGANGTEIQRRGGRPAETFSSGTAALVRPDLCQEVHQAYLESGADVIITNTYSANGNVMASSGNGGRVDECIMAASALARRAALNHVAEHAAQVAQVAASASAAASSSAAAVTAAAARATTSLQSNNAAQVSATGSLKSTRIAAESVNVALHAIEEVHAHAAAAKAAAAAALAASEGLPLPEATPPIEQPEPVRMKGWDSAGFGPSMIVASMSTHPPEMAAGGESSCNAKWPSPEIEERNYFQAARAIRLSGVDMLFLEMMKDSDHAPRAVRAAVSTGLPVFIGFSMRTDKDTGQLVQWSLGNDSVPATPEWFHNLTRILGANMVGVNVMHTDFGTMGPALKFIREDCGWQGPLGCYPDHGRFAAPDWIFQELCIEEAIECVESWIRDYDVKLIGGCCGLGPEYITALSAFTRRYNTEVRHRLNGTASA